MLGTYMENLKRWAAERHAATAAARAHNARPLDTKIREWWAGLPPEQRRPQISMAELVAEFNCAPGSIGTALHRLGWARRRSWRNGGSYARFWVPAP